MLFTPRNISHGWKKVKSFAGQAWSVSGRALHTADRYFDIAARLANSLEDVAPTGATREVKRALDSYGQARSRIQDVRDKTEGAYARVKGNVPELF